MSPSLGVGQWGMFTGPEGKQVVILHDEPVGPISARKVLSETPRRLLLDEGRVAEASVAPHADISEFVECSEGAYRVEVRQIVTPWSSTVVGVLAGVWPADADVPAPPLVGSWEWIVSMDEDGHVTGRRTFWNRSLFDLYEVSDDVARQSGYWEVDVWASDLIAEGDSLRFFTSLRDGYWNDWTGVRCATFDAIAGYGTDERRKKHLRLVAQKGRMSTDDELILHGFSYAVPEVFADRALAEEYPTDNALTGFLEIVEEPLAIVDPFSLEVLMTNPTWRHEAYGAARSMTEILAEDAGEVRQFLMDVADDGHTVRTRGLVLRTGARTGRYRVKAVAMERGPGRDALAVLRLSH